MAPDGQVRTGSFPAESDKRVAAELRRQGLTPVYIGASPQRSAFDLKMPEFGGGRRKSVLYFTQELATLLSAGVPLDRALSISNELTEQKSFQEVGAEVLRAIKGGKTMADALAMHPAYFSEIYVNMVRAGEASGQLQTMFERLAEFEKTRDELRGYVVSALVYPALLATVGLCSVIVLLYFVVPRFAQVFQESRIAMPLPTQVMLQASLFVRTYGLFLLIVGAGFTLSFLYTSARPRGGCGGICRG